MFTRTKLVLSLIIACSATAAGALDRYSGTNRTSLTIQRQTVPPSVSARASHAEVRVRNSDFERIWFRQAEGPEWN